MVELVRTEGYIIYVFNSKKLEKFIRNCMVVNEEEQFKWYCHLGHPLGPILKTLFPSIFKNDDHLNFNCKVCFLSKHHRNVYPRRNRMSDSMFSTVYSDVWGPTPNTLVGYRYFVSFIDDASRMDWVFLLKSKDEFFSAYKIFHEWAKAQFPTKIRIFCHDNSKYLSKAFLEYV